MNIEREIGEKGQVVIPKDIRKFLGLQRGQKVIFEVREKEVVLKPSDPEKFLEDFLNVPKLKKPLKTKDIKRMLEEQYDLP